MYQEVVLSAECSCRLGALVLDWSYLEFFATKYVVEAHEARQGRAGIHLSIPLWTYQDRFNRYKPLSMSIKQTRDLLVTDP